MTCNPLPRIVPRQEALGAVRRGPVRRWFRFSLRTLFLVMTLCGWLSYNLNWIWQRHDALAHLHIGVYHSAGGSTWNNVPMDPSRLVGAQRDVKAPWNLRLMGESGIGTISVYGPDHASIAANLARLFPEADVDSQMIPPLTDLEARLEMRKRIQATTRGLLQPQTSPSSSSAQPIE